MKNRIVVLFTVAALDENGKLEFSNVFTENCRFPAYQSCYFEFKRNVLMVNVLHPDLPSVPSGCECKEVRYPDCINEYPYLFKEVK